MIWPLSLLTKPRPDRNAANVFIAINQLTAKVTSMNSSVDALKTQVTRIEGNFEKAFGLLKDYKKKLDDALAAGITEADVKAIADQLGKDNDDFEAEIAADTSAPVAAVEGDAAAAAAQ